MWCDMMRYASDSVVGLNVWLGLSTGGVRGSDLWVVVLRNKKCNIWVKKIRQKDFERT